MPQDDKREITLRLQWNSAMDRSLRECSWLASSWIRSRIDLNRELIGELRALSQ